MDLMVKFQCLRLGLLLKFVAKLRKGFHETCLPETKMSTIRIVLSLAVQNRYELRQLDIRTAYLNGKLDEDVIMKQPEGFEKFDEEGKPSGCLFKKNLYGKKQSHRNWQRTL